MLITKEIIISLLITNVFLVFAFKCVCVTSLLFVCKFEQVLSGFEALKVILLIINFPLNESEDNQDKSRGKYVLR